jgi:hypothetical protein
MAHFDSCQQPEKKDAHIGNRGKHRVATQAGQHGKTIGVGPCNHAHANATIEFANQRRLAEPDRHFAQGSGHDQQNP